MCLDPLTSLGNRKEPIDDQRVVLSNGHKNPRSRQMAFDIKSDNTSLQDRLPTFAWDSAVSLRSHYLQSRYCGTCQPLTYYLMSSSMPSGSEWVRLTRWLIKAYSEHN